MIALRVVEDFAAPWLALGWTVTPHSAEEVGGKRVIVLLTHDGPIASFVCVGCEAATSEADWIATKLCARCSGGML